MRTSIAPASPASVYGTGRAGSAPVDGADESPSRRIAIADPTARAREFDRAYRHSRTVRILRWLLPATAVALFASYGISMRLLVPTGNGGRVALTVPTLTDQNLTMSNPEYQGFNKDGSRFVVRAKTAAQDVRQQNAPIALTGIEARSLDLNGAVTVAASPRGLYDRGAAVLELFDRVTVRAETGMVVTMTRATINQREGTVTSPEPVLVEMPTGWVHGNALTLDQKAKRVAFTAGVTALLQPTPADDIGRQAAASAGLPLKPSPDASVAPGLPGPSLLSASRAPVEVTSDRLDIDDEQRLAVFQGQVRAVQGEATLTARTLNVTYAGRGGEGVAGAGAQTSGAARPAVAAAPGSQVKSVVARDNVVLTRGTETAQAPLAVFDAATEKASLTGGVLLTQAPDRQATAERADIDVKAQTSRLSGSVVLTAGSDQRASAEVADLDQKNDTAVLSGPSVLVSQGHNTLRGQRLRIDRKAGVTELTTPAGRIAAHFLREQPSGPASPKTAGTAAGLGSTGTGIKIDTAAPVDIEAERMVAIDARKTVTFTGDVVAVQAGYTLRTPELVATYAGEIGLMRDPATGQPQKARTAKEPKSAASAETHIRRIAARKRVHMTSAADEEVIGDWAEFDPATNVALIGRDEGAKGGVTLRQGGSRTTCTRVRVEMGRGQMLCDAPLRGNGDSVAQIPQAPVIPLTVPTTIPKPGTANEAATKSAIEKIKNGECQRACGIFAVKELRERAGAAAKRNPAAAAEIEAAAKEAAKTAADSPTLKRILPKNSSSSWTATTSPNDAPSPGAAGQTGN